MRYFVRAHKRERLKVLITCVAGRVLTAAMYFVLAIR